MTQGVASQIAAPFSFLPNFVIFAISFAFASVGQGCAPRIVSDDTTVSCPAISFIFSHVGNDAMKTDEIKAIIPIARHAARFLPFPCREAGV